MTASRQIPRMEEILLCFKKTYSQQVFYKPES